MGCFSDIGAAQNRHKEFDNSGSVELKYARLKLWPAVKGQRPSPPQEQQEARAGESNGNA
jgi:hypothetical protein